MTYTPTRETLELAALACGKPILFRHSHVDWWLVHLDGDDIPQKWQPHLSTKQGKADLLDIVASVVDGYDIKDGFVRMWNLTLGSEIFVKIINDKHAALMEAAIKVAAMVGEKMKGGV